MSVPPRTLLAVLAHPDDESFGVGGTLALYAGRGFRVILVCATRGEAGTVDPGYLEGYASVAELREAELRCAAQHLGLEAIHFLDYRDSGMPGMPENSHPDAQIAHPVEEVAARIVRYIRESRAEVVLTFDPAGGYRHPDHIHVQRATTLAFERSGDPQFEPDVAPPHHPRALYYHVFPHGLLRLLTRLMPLVGANPRRWGRNKDIDLKELSDQLSSERQGIEKKKQNLDELDSKLQRDRQSVEEMDRMRNELVFELRQMSVQIDKSREKLARCRTEREANAAQREVEELPRNRVAVKIDIEEGKTSGIRHINVVGVKVFDEGDVYKQSS